MEVARYWRLNKQYLRMEGVICPSCEEVIFPPRDICPSCHTTTKNSDGKSIRTIVYDASSAKMSPNG